MGFSALLHPDNREVGQKLGLATLCMFTLPIGVFYLCLYIVFAHKSEPLNWAGGAAIATANVIIAAYCYMAYWEDMGDDDKNKNRALDADGPKVGVFKQRTD